MLLPIVVLAQPTLGPSVVVLVVGVVVTDELLVEGPVELPPEPLPLLPLDSVALLDGTPDVAVTGSIIKPHPSTPVAAHKTAASDVTTAWACPVPSFEPPPLVGSMLFGSYPCCGPFCAIRLVNWRQPLETPC